MMKKIREKIYYNRYLIMLLCGLLIVYGYSMFNNRPWYDELYTYYYFISRGPVYAAIHWPVPNNHMGYSVLSAFLDIFSNSYIGLRGVSVISSTVSVYLLYRICKNLKIKQFFTVIGCFMGSYLVYSLAFQGRGYALTTMCFLLAVNALVDIAAGEDKLLSYIIWVCALTWGLYTIASSTYWVIPVCLSGGAYLLMTGKYRKLFKLIVASVVAALATLSMYSVVWLAIGSNLLCKDSGTAFFGMYQLDVIKHAPIAAWKTGMQYMLDTPYIQSIDRGDVITGLWGYFVSLFDQYYAYLHPYMGIVTCMVYILSVIVSLTEIIRYISSHKKIKEDADGVRENDTGIMIPVMVAVFGISIPLMLIIQSVNPYLRVFSFLAVIIGFMTYELFKAVFAFFDSRLKREDRVYDMIETGIGIVIMFMAVISNVIFTFNFGNDNSFYPIQLADRENDIYDALKQSAEDAYNIDSIYYTDDFQKYVLKFYFDKDPAETSFEEADYVMVSRALFESSETEEWPMLVYADSFDFEYLDENFERLTPNKAVYGKKQKENAYFLYRRR